MLVSGYYGFGNLGDEALLEVIVQRLRATFAPARIEVLSATPQRTAAAYGVEATSRWDWRAVRAAIARADVVLSGGGGLLQNATSFRSLLYYAAILREAARAGRKTMIFAQSIGPLDRLGRLTVRRFCRGVQRATVRDERSRTLLSDLLPHTVNRAHCRPRLSLRCRRRIRRSFRGRFGTAERSVRDRQRSESGDYRPGNALAGARRRSLS